jgi:hypothetical protein
MRHSADTPTGPSRQQHPATSTYEPATACQWTPRSDACACLCRVSAGRSGWIVGHSTEAGPQRGQSECGPPWISRRPGWPRILTSLSVAVPLSHVSGAPSAALYRQSGLPCAGRPVKENARGTDGQGVAATVAPAFILPCACGSREAAGGIPCVRPRSIDEQPDLWRYLLEHLFRCDLEHLFSGCAAHEEQGPQSPHSKLGFGCCSGMPGPG